jgi:hypothetical protein
MRKMPIMAAILFSIIILWEAIDLLKDREYRRHLIMIGLVAITIFSILWDGRKKPD